MCLPSGRRQWNERAQAPTHPFPARRADGSRYSGPLACARDVLAHDGLRGFLKGWLATYARLGPHTVIMFLTAEELRRAAGLQSL
jgi:hypothetical protein